MQWHKAGGKVHHFHATGKYGVELMPRLLKERGVDINSPYLHITEYINNMDVLMAAADLVICRAGAITVSELQAQGKPAVLIPSPNVAENHQFYNVKVLRDIDAAILIEEKDLNEKTITESFEKLYQNPQLIMDMGQRAKTAYNPRCVDIIYENLDL